MYATSESLIGKLLNGKIVGLSSCGCRARSKIDNKYRKYYNKYKKSAIDTSKEFSIDLQKFINIIEQPCIYCGTKPRLRQGSGERLILANGIDRSDSNLGYVYGNVVPCCETCNLAKNNMTSEEYISHCVKVSNWNIDKSEGGST